MINEISKFIEVLLFLENEPLSLQTLMHLTHANEDEIRNAVEELAILYREEGHGLFLEENNDTYQFIPIHEMHDKLKSAYGRKVDKRLSKAALETLSIIAYAQPVTRVDVENIRGVSSDSIMRMLLEREYIHKVGKKDVPGRPALYGTSKKFLLEFNLSSISALPKLSDIDRERFLQNEEGTLL